MRNTTFEQIVQMVSHIGGSKNLDAVTKYYPELKNHYTAQNIVERVSRSGGWKNITIMDGIPVPNIETIEATIQAPNVTTDNVNDSQAENAAPKLLTILDVSNDDNSLMQTDVQKKRKGKETRKRAKKPKNDAIQTTTVNTVPENQANNATTFNLLSYLTTKKPGASMSPWEQEQLKNAEIRKDPRKGHNW